MPRKKPEGQEEMETPEEPEVAEERSLPDRLGEVLVTPYPKPSAIEELLAWIDAQPEEAWERKWEGHPEYGVMVRGGYEIVQSVSYTWIKHISGTPFDFLLRIQSTMRTADDLAAEALAAVDVARKE